MHGIEKKLQPYQSDNVIAIALHELYLYTGQSI